MMIKGVLFACLAVGVSAVSFGVFRYTVNQNIEIGKPVAEQRQAELQRREEVKARTDTLETLLTSVRASLEQHPNDSMLVINAANIAYDLGQYDLAERYYRRFLTNIDKSNATAKINLSFVVFQQQRTEEAMDILAALLAADPKNQTAMFNMAYILEQLGRVDEAYDWMRRCAAANANSPLGQQATQLLAQRETSSTQQ